MVQNINKKKKYNKKLLERTTNKQSLPTMKELDSIIEKQPE